MMINKPVGFLSSLYHCHFHSLPLVVLVVAAVKVNRIELM